VPEVIEVEDTDHDNDENLVLKVFMKERKKLESNSKFKNRRTEELAELQKLRNSKSTIQIVVVLSKDIKIEFTASCKESMADIYGFVAQHILYKGEFEFFTAPPRKEYKNNTKPLRENNITKGMLFRVNYKDNETLKNTPALISNDVIADIGIL